MRVKIEATSRVFEDGEFSTVHIGEERNLSERAALELIASGNAVSLEPGEEQEIEEAEESAAQLDDTIDADGDASVNATAAAEALAKSLDVDLQSVQPTGKDLRGQPLITKGDVAAAAKAKEQQ